MFFQKTKKESVEDKFTRVLSFCGQMIETTKTLIEELKSSGNHALAMENYSHLIRDHSEISVMLWRRGDDPRPSIAELHRSYQEAKSFRDSIDPDHRIPMEKISGITDWDLVYSLMWLTGKPSEFEFFFPRLFSERYFAYSRLILHRVTDTNVPESLGAAVEGFQTHFDESVDRNFRDLTNLLNDEHADTEIDNIVARVESNWVKRRKAAFYNISAPLTAGFDASNDLSVNYQMACVLKKRGLMYGDSPHSWRWH